MGTRRDRAGDWPLDDGTNGTLEIQDVFKRPKVEQSQATPAPAQVQNKKKVVPPTPKDAARAQRTDALKPESKTAKSGLAPRIQRAAAKQTASTGKRS